MTGTKVYINLIDPWIITLGWFQTNGITTCADAKHRFFKNYGEWMEEICEDEWSYDTEFDYSVKDLVELKPFLTFKSNNDALRFKLEWKEG